MTSPRRRLAVTAVAAAAVTAAALVAACGSPSKPSRPGTVGNKPGGGAAAAPTSLGWTRATEITIADTWVGLGCVHTFAANLSRRGDRLVGIAQLEAGNGQDRETRPVTVDDAAIAALEAAVVAAQQVPAWDPTTLTSWTDDYPSGATTFTGPDGVSRLYFEDQHRQLKLERGGAVVPLHEPPPASPDDRDGGPRPLWAAYQAFLDGSLGLRAWIDSKCP